MVPDLTLEVIYFKQPTDFKMEFDICGCCNIRFLSKAANDKKELLSALGKSVARSRVTVTVGSFNPLDYEYLPKIIAAATNYVLKPIDSIKYNIPKENTVLLPDTAIPLINKNGVLGGCVLESKDQAIIMLTSDRSVRQSVVTELVCPYLAVFSGKESNETLNISAQDREDSKKPQDTVLADANSGTEPALPEQHDESYAQPYTEQINEVGQEPNADPQSDGMPNFAPQEDSDVNDSTEPQKNYIVLEQPGSVFERSDGFAEFLLDNGTKSADNKQKKSVLKPIISIILVVTVLLLAYFGYEKVYQPMHHSVVYKNAQELYGGTWEGLPENMLYKFGKLYHANKDIVGWLSVPNTSISLPVVTAANKSALYYQTHLFEGSVNRFGTPYTLSKISEESYNRNLVIYGKDVHDGVFFSDLELFCNLEQYRSAPTLSFDTLYIENKWKIFSVIQTNNQNLESYAASSFFDDSDFSKYLEKIKQASLIETNVSLNEKDELLTLVCKGEEKSTLVIARKVRDNESPLVDVTESKVNANPSFPQTASESAVQAGAILKEYNSSADVSSTPKAAYKNVEDNGQSRYEQHSPTSSAVKVKPTAPVYSKNDKTDSKSQSSSKGSDSSEKQSSLSSTQQPTDINNMPNLSVKNISTGKIVSGPANEIVAQVIEAEMGSGYHTEALKAQAVAAYSWMLCNGAAIGKTPSVPMKTAGNRAIQAANAVAGIVATYNGNVAQTYYYAISAGRTANCQDIWSASLPYLVSVDSSVDKNINGYQTLRKYRSGDVAAWAKESLGVDLSKIQDKADWFKCTYDKNGLYVKNVKIGSKTVNGTYLRESFFTSSRVGAANVLRSSAYTISYSKTEDKFIFTVKGYGHGVGMSQVGANAYAKSGWGYEKILKHYYPGISFALYTK